MTASIVILVEEESCKIVLEYLLPKMGLEDRSLIIKHDGKSDLERSIPRKIGHWRSEVEPRFIVSRDSDGADRDRLKSRLLSYIPTEKQASTKIRIVVNTLESWYLGDIQALREADVGTPRFHSELERSAKYRDLCRLTNAEQIFKEQTRLFGKRDAAHRVGPHMCPTRNRAPSFRAFVAALEWAALPR